MNFKKISLLSIIVGFTLFAGCASGSIHRGDRRTRVDRIPAKQSSYRIRGTDETGVLNRTQQMQLKSRTRAWRWPTNEVVVTSNFGSRSGEHHDGVDLRAQTGTEVRAAYDGRVIYSGNKIRGYGRMIVLRHDLKLSTVYAHNSKLYVKSGQRVRRGQLISLSGNTGRSSGPHLHFEVREGVTAINPLILLPSPAIANEANRRMRAATNRPTRPTKYSQSSSTRLAARVVEGDGFKPKSPRSTRAQN